MPNAEYRSLSSTHGIASAYFFNPQLPTPFKPLLHENPFPNPAYYPDYGLVGGSSTGSAA